MAADDAPGKTPAIAPAAVPAPPQQLDYSSNLKSEVFGAKLFTGAFARLLKLQ